MKRITPEEVVEAYRKTGMRAQQFDFGDTECGCPLTAIAASQGFDLECPGGAVDLLRDSGYDEDYLTGFYEGVDGLLDVSKDSSVYTQGHADGRAAWAAVVAAGLVKD